jgi:hypothetical protein
MIRKLRNQPYAPKWEQPPKWEQKERKNAARGLGGVRASPLLIFG